ncbi:cupin domain-containing protein [Pseudomonas sp. LA21]|uniref:cupin domain-containing protein n=1 Tax=unclassified Pseudomonas TaxID=196821 RepID=UPI001FB7EDB9|nr:cupin domain-containing protein [Pseudomonas sp. LA21]MCJ1885691.1 cupin domain-containing protein [Pseudomonas sp. LA21]
MHPRARYLIDTLGLAPHPEGGFYRRVFDSTLMGADGRQQSSAIFFLLPGGTVSRWHRVDADELWHYHEGGPLELLVAEQPDAPVRIERLGPVSEGSLPQRAVPAHAWQAARCLGDYVLVGCTVSPAFEFAGFKLLSDDAQAQLEWPQLVGEFPELL